MNSDNKELTSLISLFHSYINYESTINSIPNQNKESIESSITSYITSNPLLLKYTYEYIWYESLRLKSSPQQKSNLILLTKSFLSKSILNKEILIEKLDESTLLSLNLIEDEKIIQQKMKVMTTKFFFQQEKYNLLKEESEGYSKLLYYLYEIEYSQDELEEIVIGYIGFFDIDPNKVVEMMFDCLYLNEKTNNTKEEVLIRLISKMSKKSNLIDMLCWKISCFEDKETDGKTDKIKQGLYFYIAKFITLEIIDYSDIVMLVSGLVPTDSIIDTNSHTIEKIYMNLRHNKDVPFQEKKSLAYAVALSSGSNNASELNENNTVPVGSIIYIHNYSFQKILLYYKEKKTFPSQISNDKYFLLEGLLKNKNQKDSLVLFSQIQNSYDCLYSDTLNKTLCDLIEWMIDDLYKDISNLNGIYKNDSKSNESIMEIDDNPRNNSQFNKCKDYNDLFDKLPFLLSILRHGLYINQRLFYKILKVTNKYLSTKTMSTTKHIDYITFITKHVFISSISMIESPSSQLVSEFNLLFKWFSQENRYDIYSFWLNSTYFSHYSLYLKHASILKDTSKWVNLINKENIKSSGRSLSILITSNPLLCLYYIVNNMTNYNNFFEFFLNVIQLTQSYIILDSISYIFFILISNNENSSYTGEDKQNHYKITKFYKKLYSNIALFYKKFPFLQFSHIFLYIFKGLSEKTVNFIELNLLKEMIQLLSGLPIQTEMKNEQIMSLSGGDKLIIDVFGILNDYKIYMNSVWNLIDMISNVDGICIRHSIQNEVCDMIDLESKLDYINYI